MCVCVLFCFWRELGNQMGIQFSKQKFEHFIRHVQFHFKRNMKNQKENVFMFDVNVGTCVSLKAKIQN